MNENINLCELLKGHEGETFYSPLFGNVRLKEIKNVSQIIVKTSEGNIKWFYLDGKYYNYSEAECLLFPSKNQRDWDKWTEEQKPKVPKTWDEFSKISYKYADSYPHAIGNTVFERNDVTLIEKSALALLKIHQLIEVGYGGNITDEEWENNKLIKYTIKCRNNEISLNNTFEFKDIAAFHTEAQRAEFLSYPENVQLVKNFYMI